MPCKDVRTYSFHSPIFIMIANASQNQGTWPMWSGCRLTCMGMWIYYVVTWNVKTYVSHPLKCRMCQNWLKWCSDPPTTTTPKLQLDFLDLENFLIKVWGGGGGVSSSRPPPTTPKLQLDFLDLEIFLVKVWGSGGGGCMVPDPPPTTTPKLNLLYI